MIGMQKHWKDLQVLFINRIGLNTSGRLLWAHSKKRPWVEILFLDKSISASSMKSEF
jgi:hypothetical protein